MRSRMEALSGQSGLWVKNPEVTLRKMEIVEA